MPTSQNYPEYLRELEIPRNLGPVQSVEVGVNWDRMCAVTTEGEAIGWAIGGLDDLDSQSDRRGRFVSVTIGLFGTYGIRTNGFLDWRSLPFSQTKGYPCLQKVPRGLGRVRSIVAAVYEDYAVKEDGTVLWWENKDKGTKPHIVPGLAQIQSLVVGGHYRICAIRENGTLVCRDRDGVLQELGQTKL